MNLDERLDERLELSRELAIPHLLLASYLYYLMDVSIFSDERYDLLCKQVYMWWDELNHYHKYLIDKDSLKAGSLYYLKEEDYPTITKHRAHDFVNMGK